MPKKLSSIKNIMSTQQSQYHSSTTEAGVKESQSSLELTEREKKYYLACKLEEGNPIEVDKEVRLSVLLELSGMIDIKESYQDGKISVNRIVIHSDDKEKLHRALKISKGYCTTLEDDDLLARLTIMFSMMNKQNFDEEDLELKIRSLVQQINHVDKIPADIMIKCIDYMTKYKEWYPSYADIYKFCGDKFMLRKKLTNALHERIKYLQ